MHILHSYRNANHAKNLLTKNGLIRFQANGDIDSHECDALAVILGEIIGQDVGSEFSVAIDVPSRDGAVEKLLYAY